MSSPSDYAETAALLAILEDEPDRARGILTDFYPSELSELRGQLADLIDLVDDMLDEFRRGERT